MQILIDVKRDRFFGVLDKMRRRPNLLNCVEPFRYIFDGNIPFNDQTPNKRLNLYFLHL